MGKDLAIIQYYWVGLPCLDFINLGEPPTYHGQLLLVYVPVPVTIKDNECLSERFHLLAAEMLVWTRNIH